ncbi:Fis family transcriptional regulator, factor for inversion stimulation protein [Solimonas aquatica]|uniref:Putative Fis-like DNA-binding protein n=1 Tax=Solimonas aquatica TaxID=489703 RepID=A0A1H9C057_9GAMM|nr:helix-turn-helix domain-containing protein [Solimonas aquatica]SEP94539.1 Fis family transcriptional regulator, factor for inversion stimulation protein [Solimonas aquatica]
MSSLRSSDIKPLGHSVSECLDDFFRTLNGHAPQNLYDLFLDQVEPPLLKSTLRYCHGNQSRAAEMLGLNRATLRKKLKHHKIKAESP